MADSSIKSAFQMLSFKMDKIDFSVTPTLGVLSMNLGAELGENDFKISFRNPFRYTEDNKNLYVTGLMISLSIKNKDKNEIANGVFTITGLFSAENFEDKSIEEKLAKFQAPTILLPYIRSCITSTLANAGFGSIVLPLINMNAVAQTVELQIEDKTKE